MKENYLKVAGHPFPLWTVDSEKQQPNTVTFDLKPESDDKQTNTRVLVWILLL